MAWTKVKDGLFVGDRDSVQDYDLLEPNSITYFCNCAAGELDFFWEGVEFLTFHWEDHPAYTYFDEGGIVVDQIVAFVDEGLRKGQSVLIYSSRGLGRSVGCCAAYMMVKYGWGCDKVFEFFESKRVAMDLNPGLAAALYALDWRLQRRRLHYALALPEASTGGLGPFPAGTRPRALEANRAKLLTWHTGADLLVDPAMTEDLSADEMVLVNSFVNGRSAFTHTRVGMPSPPQGPAAARATATALRWIDEDGETPARRAAPGSGGVGRVGGAAEEAAWAEFCARSKPILDYNECFLTDDEEDEGQEQNGALE